MAHAWWLVGRSTNPCLCTAVPSYCIGHRIERSVLDAALGDPLDVWRRRRGTQAIGVAAVCWDVAAGREGESCSGLLQTDAQQ